MKFSRLLAPVMCALLASTVTFAQKSASFNILTSPAEPDNPSNIYAVDVNNDGLTDIVEDNGYSPGSYFYVNINKGNGTFAPPVAYAIPVGYSPTCIAPGDYDNDGKVDLAVPLNGTEEVAVYLGNGDGTFQSPILSTVDLPNGDTFNDAGCAAADFNGDGKIDLAAWGGAGVYVLQGKGNGSFNATAYPVPSTNGNGGDGNWPQLFVGDYNGDGKADIATAPGESQGPSAIDVFYGNGDFTFNQTIPYTYSGGIMIGSGDLNSDGITDLYAVVNSTSAGAQQLGVFYGTHLGTFNSYLYDVPATYRLGAGPAGPPFDAVLTLGDYNGDGRMDLAAAATDTSNNDVAVVFFLAGASPGEFTTQAVDVPVTPSSYSFPVAGLLSGGYLKPDVTLNIGNDGSDDTTPTTLSALLNTTNGYFGFCPYPKSGKGFHVCAAGISDGDIAGFSAAVDSFNKLRTIELWVDGKKVADQSNTWDTHAYFDWAGEFSTGTHKARSMRMTWIIRCSALPSRSRSAGNKFSIKLNRPRPARLRGPWPVTGSLHRIDVGFGHERTERARTQGSPLNDLAG